MSSDSSHHQANSVLDRLRSAEQLIAELDLTSLSPDELPAVTNAVRRLQNRCTATTIAIAKQARATGDDPDATLLGRGGVSGSTARRERDRADTTDAMPDLDDAVSSGDISGEHLDAIGRARKGLSDAEREVFDQLAAELAEIAANLPVDTFKRRLRKIIDQARRDHGLTRLQQQRAASGLKMWEDANGMGHAHITADSERFAMFRSAVERHAATLAAAAKQSGESVTMGPGLMLDALIDLLGQAQGHLGRPTITILIDEPTLRTGPHEGTICETDAGVDLPISVVGRHLCDSVTDTVRFDGNGRPLDVGRRYRTATSAQWTALKAMYRTCAWHGCSRPITWCQAHHITEWEHGGETNLDNLIPLCSTHHHAVHEGGWRVVLHPDRTLDIYSPTPDRTATDRSSTPQSPHRYRSRTKSSSPPSSGPPPHSREHHRATTRPDRKTRTKPADDPIDDPAMAQCTSTSTPSSGSSSGTSSSKLDQLQFV